MEEEQGLPISGGNGQQKVVFVSQLLCAGVPTFVLNGGADGAFIIWSGSGIGGSK
jgi:hypothetical protein